MSEVCPDYREYSKLFHGPASGGPLGLAFQRPIEACRRFTSDIINTVIESVASKITDLDLARLFVNAFPNTLDTTIWQTACMNQTNCLPLSFIITGDINAMWLRDSANQLLPYLDYVKKDVGLQKLFLGAIYMQAHFIQLDPYANAFDQPSNLDLLSRPQMMKRDVERKQGVFERKWEIDSLGSFLGLSYRYWNTTQDASFTNSTSWINAVELIIQTLVDEQTPTYISNRLQTPHYTFQQQTNRPTETQFINGRGMPVKYTGMVKSLFRPSDDATVYPFFVPGNAMLSVELANLSNMLHKTKQHDKLALQANQLSRQIKKAIYKHAIVHHPEYGRVFAYEVDGYGSSLIMDDANVPSLLSLSLLGFVEHDNPIYQNTRRLVLSDSNPYYFSGPRGSGIGGPHVDLNYAWPMSQIVRILSSSNDTEISEALSIILHSTDGTGLVHESFNVNRDNDTPYTRSWFSWANGLFGQAILKIAKERPHLIFRKSQLSTFPTSSFPLITIRGGPAKIMNRQG
ncbi:glycoside hydrolase family 125 protein [Phycomyces blakesleeanus]|uniref:Glycoside hydrolase family 125 protein n=1 Tax=Phycomyces blakesleeanus TaxID=4837 RepID=A0ABR3AXA3_PHYBL